MNLSGGFYFLFDTIVNLYLYIVIARFVLQVVRADFYNPVSQFIVKATSPLLLPMRKIIPGIGGIDVASIVLLYGLVIVKLLLTGLLFGVDPLLGPQVVVYALTGIGSITGMAGLVINFFIFVIFIMVVLSWLAMAGGHNPMADIVRQMAEPVLAPARKIIPPMGMLDLTPMIVLLVLYFIKIVFGL